MVGPMGEMEEGQTLATAYNGRHTVSELSRKTGPHLREHKGMYEGAGRWDGEGQRLVALLTLRNRGDQQVGFREELSSKAAWEQIPCHLEEPQSQSFFFFSLLEPWSCRMDL